MKLLGNCLTNPSPVRFTGVYSQEFSMSLNASFMTSERINGRTRPFAAHRAALLFPVIEREQAAMTTSEDLSMAYVGFNYAVPALEQAALPTPDFPAVPGRLAYCNGRYLYEADTVVSYKRGRKMVTEWHALAGIRAA